MQSTVKNVLGCGREKLSAAGIETSWLDALVLLANTSGLSKEMLLAFDEYSLDSLQAEHYFDLIERRANECPVQYIINKAEFMGIDFYVDENVLIPRADTEILVEILIERAKQMHVPKILDLCSGSGCIAISVAYYLEKACVVGADISVDAVKIARNNAIKAGVNERTEFCVSDLFANIPVKNFDIIASNPPYIPQASIDGLMRQVRDFEPRIALCGGISGLDFYEKIAVNISEYIKPDGLILLEIGFDQADKVCGILDRHNFSNIKVIKDLKGLDRVVEATYTEVKNA